jgi:hypothetical protein
LLAWAITQKEAIQKAVDEDYPIHMLGEHINNKQDTQDFKEAFNDEMFGQCK